MAPIKAGDRVKIVTRDVTSEDPKTGLYYSYFGGLTGTVDRIYEDGSVCVDIDLEALTADMRERHQAMQETERQRWLANLSDEARNRLTAEQKKLKMSYKILTSKKDLEPDKGGKPRAADDSKPAAQQGGSGEKKGSAPPSPSSSIAAAAPTPEPAAKTEKPEPSDDEESPKRLSEADLAAAEEAFLRSRQQGA